VVVSVAIATQDYNASAGGTGRTGCKDYIIIYSCCDIIKGHRHTMKDKFNDHKKVMFIIKYLRSPQEGGRRTAVDKF